MIKVQTLAGAEYEFEVEPTDKVLRIKQLVADKEKVPPVEQRSRIKKKTVKKIPESFFFY